MAGARAHGLVLSFPMQGHINPLLQLSSKLAAASGCAITFVLTDFEYAHAKRRQKEERTKKKKKMKKKRQNKQKQKGLSSANKNKKEHEGLQQQNSDDEGGEEKEEDKHDYDHDNARAKNGVARGGENGEEKHDYDGNARPKDGAGGAEDDDDDGSGGDDDDDDDEDLAFGLPGCVRLVGVPDKLPPSSSRTGGAEFRDSYDALVNMQEGVERLLTKLRSSSLATPVSFILADTFVHWAHLVARQFNLPLFSFFTSNAASALIFLHAPSLVAEEVLPFREEDDKPIAEDPVTSISGLPPIQPCDFPLCFTFALSHYRYQFVLKHHENFHYSSAMLINTFEELESAAVVALHQDICVLPIGPLLLLLGAQGATINKLNLSYWQEETESLRWLDCQEASSVLYISFGSISTMSTHQIYQLALGLEASNQPFLWVIRTDSIDGSLSGNLPDGFLSRTKHKGLIISWAPQLAVLAHSNVGGFMTHCGWNSTLENISVGGLPTICWPLVAEQRMNCRMFVDDWKIGIEVVKGDDGIVDKYEVERVVRVLMQGDEGKEMKARVTKLQDSAGKAMQNGGSSITNFEAFTQLLAAT